MAGEPESFTDLTKGAQFNLGFRTEGEQTFVDDAFGVPVQVIPLEGEPMEKAIPRTIKKILDDINSDPNRLGQAKAVDQIKRGEANGDPLDPQFRLDNLSRQLDAPVVTGDVENFFVRFQMAKQQGPFTMTNKVKILEESFPDSEIRIANDLDGSPVILVRHPGTTDFIEAESPDFTMGDIEALMGGVFSTEVAGEMAAFIGSRGTSLLGKALRAGLGAATGEFVGSKGQELLQGLPQGPLIERIVGTGSSAAIGTALFDPIARIVNIIRGVRGVTVPTPEAMQIRKFADQENLPALLPGQLNPVFESIQQQASGTSQRLQTAIVDVSSKTIDRLKQLRDELGDFRNIPDKTLRSVIDKEESSILSAIGNPKMSFSQAGKSIVKGFEDFTELLAEREGRVYKEAFNLSKAKGGVRFNLKSVKQVSAFLKIGQTGSFKFDDIGLRVNLPFIPISNPSLKAAMRQLEKEPFDVVVSSGNASSLEQMIRMRSKFFNMKNDPSLTNEEQAVAAIMHKAFTQTMKFPRNLRGTKGNLRPATARAWRRAASITTSRERFLSKSYRNIHANVDKPSELAKKLNLKNPDFVLGVRRRLMVSGQREKWLKVQAAYKTNLLNDPGSISRKFKTAESKEALDALVPVKTQEILIDASEKWARLHSGPISKMRNKIQKQAERSLELVNRGTRRELKSFIEAVGGRETPEGKALQAGIIETLLNKSTKIDKGRAILNKSTFLTGLAQFRSRGILEEVFDKETLKRIDNYEKFVSFMPDVMGMGEGLQKAGITAAAGKAFLPTPTAIGSFVTKAIPGLSRNAIIAWAFTSKVPARFLAGSGKIIDTTGGASFHNKMVAVGGALGVIVDNMEDIASSGSFDIPEDDVIRGISQDINNVQNDGLF